MKPSPQDLPAEAVFLLYEDDGSKGTGVPSPPSRALLAFPNLATAEKFYEKLRSGKILKNKRRPRILGWFAQHGPKSPETILFGTEELAIMKKKTGL